MLIGLAVYCTFGLQFFVCLEIGWNAIKDKFVKRPTMVNYLMRTLLVTGATLLAVAVPTISPFIGLIGAFCFSILGLLIPVTIEILIKLSIQIFIFISFYRFSLKLSHTGMMVLASSIG